MFLSAKTIQPNTKRPSLKIKNCLAQDEVQSSKTFEATIKNDSQKLFRAINSNLKPGPNVIKLWPVG
jgi:hypothetical protein